MSVLDPGLRFAFWLPSELLRQTTESLSLTFLICKVKTSICPLQVFVVLKWNISKLSRAQTVLGDVYPLPFLLHTILLTLFYFFFWFWSSYAWVRQVKGSWRLKLNKELVWWFAILSWRKDYSDISGQEEKNLLYAPYKQDGSWAICFILGS